MHAPTRLATRDLVLAFIGRLVSWVRWVPWVFHPGSHCKEIFGAKFSAEGISDKMDVADRTTGVAHVRDDLAERCQKLFQDFLEE